MLLVLDVGNTNIVVGVYDGETLMYHWRLATDWKKTSDEYWVMLSNLFAQADLPPDAFDGICLSSVVPPLDVAFEEIAARYFPTAPVLVQPGTKTGLSMRIDNPHEVGADRIVNAVAARHLFDGPLVIVDFGTATTFDAVTGTGEFLGASIVPGISISAEALFQRAARLPRVDLHAPERAIGKNTVECLRSGLILGYACLVDGMVQRFRDELGAPDATVVATGGLAPVIGKESRAIQHVEPYLTLIGLRLIYEKNRRRVGRTRAEH